MKRRGTIEVGGPEWSDEEEGRRSRDRADDRLNQDRARAVVDRLVRMVPSETAEVPLEDVVARSLDEWRRIEGKARVGRQRLFDRMVREVHLTNLDELERALGLGDAPRTAKDDAMIELEAWRDRLLRDPEGGFDAFVGAYPEVERQPLRLALRAAVAEREGGSSGKAFKRLFALLREAAGV